MSEEEKKALENLKKILSDLEDTEDGAIISLNQEEIDSLKSIPNLIENQQHEIEGNEALIDVLKHNDKVWNELYHKQEKELKKIEDLNIPIDTLIAEFERLENIEDDREQLRQEIYDLNLENQALYESINLDDDTILELLFKKLKQENKEQHKEIKELKESIKELEERIKELLEE